MSGSTTVGGIQAFLTLSITDFEAGIARAKALADSLDRKDVDVRVKADTAGAETKLAAVDAATKKVDRSTTAMGRSQEGASRHTRALITAALTLGPALIPLAAAAAGLGVGLGAMGAAGVLAIVGINQEVKKGTPLGLAYTGMLQTLKGDLSTLSRTAATGVLGPFQDAVADLQRRMPTLNGLIGEFSGISGRTAGALTTGLVAAFISLAPLARDAGMYVLTLSTRFAELMSGSGVVSFGDYVRSVFPQVMEQFEAIVGAVLHLVAAFAPFGTGVLTLLGAFATAINAIPVDVLSVIATGGLAIFLGFKTFALLSMPIHEVGVALRFVGVSAETAAVGMRTLTIAAGVIGAIIAVAAIAYTAHSESVRKDQQAVNDLTDALIRGRGVIEADTVAERANALAKDGTLASAKLLGINLGDVTAASLGNADATAKVNAALDAYNGKTQHGVNSAKSVALANNELGDAVDKVRGATENGVKTLDLATQAYNAYNAATATAAAGGNAQAIAQQALAAKIGTTAAALAIATTGQQATADAAAQAAAKMYIENDAAGILRGSLDLLNGKALSAAQAQNSFDSSLVNMGTHVNATGKQITFTTTSINNMSSASVALRGQLNSQVTNLQNVIEANGGLANSTGKAREQMVTMRQQIIDNAVAHGVDRAAVTAYIDKLLAIPKTIPPTKLDVDKAAAEAKVNALQAQITAIKQGKVPGIDASTAEGRAKIAALQAQIDALHGKDVYISVNTTYHTAGGPGGSGGSTSADGNIFNAFANGGIRAFANGGENHVAQIAPAGAMRLWAEPETGGEAYIPLARSKRARSTAIWEETGKRLGLGSGQSHGNGATSADIAALGDRVDNLVAGFGNELQKQARTIQTMQRQMAR